MNPSPHCIFMKQCKSACVEGMLKPLLAMRARRHVKRSSSTSDVIEIAHTDLSGAEAKDGGYSYADAEKLSRLLFEESWRSKSGFFRKKWSHRLIKINPVFSDGFSCMEGIEAPANTSDMVSVSGCPSTKSAVSILTSDVESGLQTSESSLPQTCSAKTGGKPRVSENLSLYANDQSHASRMEISDSSPAQNKVARNESLLCIETFSFGSNFKRAKKWGRTMLREIKAPSRRHKIRQGKQPALFMEETYLTTVRAEAHHSFVSRELLDTVFFRPSTSQQFHHLNLKGGSGPPKYLSKKALRKLDKLDQE